jgi:hypothetical protein
MTGGPTMGESRLPLIPFSPVPNYLYIYREEKAEREMYTALPQNKRACGRREDLTKLIDTARAYLNKQQMEPTTYIARILYPV